MQSFYGGKSGFSFVIVKSFPSINEMVENFQKGPLYTAVHYDEHVLINTENKNDPDNGKVYRRGYDYTNSLGGAVYIGTIVGPSGPAPMLELTTIDEVKNKQNLEGFDHRYSEGSYSVPASLIPGKDGDQYNDAIEWACCCVRDENGIESTAYIGFKFPYLVMDFTSKSVNPYYHRSDNTANFFNQDLTERTDDGSHPFYEKWHINVPKGIKGDAFKNFRVVTANTSIQDYAGRQDDIDGSREVLVYDYYHYDKNVNGEPVTIYLGDYNMIDGITLDEEGTVTIDYSHDDTLEYTRLIKWIKSITLAGNGEFTVKYNNGDPDYTTTLTWVRDITIEDNGTITISYNNGDPRIYSKMLKYIDHIYFNDTENKFHVVYNTGDDEAIDNIIKFIDHVYIYDDPDDPNSDYKFHVVYNTGDDEAIGEPTNYILETDIDKIDYHFLVYYSNANYRDLIPAEKSRTHNGKTGWLDLGSLKDDSGVLVGFNVLLSTAPGLNDISTAIAYLNGTYPNGLTDPKYYGKIVTVGDTNENKKFYAYDYDKYEWYYLGTFDDGSLRNLVCPEDEPTLEILKNKVAVGGIWFVVEGSDDD